MKHLERAFRGNNFIPWYIIVLLLILVAQSIISLISFFVTDLFLITDKNVELLLLLLPFAFAIPIFDLLVKKIHHRTITEVINGRKRMRWGRIWSGFFVWFIMVAVLTTIDFILSPETYVLQFNLSKFFPLIFISFALIPLQAGYEEVIFRGYLMQGIATLTSYRWVAIIVSSLIFAFLHMSNPEVGKYGHIMFFNYLMMALIWSITTILDDGAEIAIGMHTANNLFISIFITEKGSAFETNALFEVSESDPYLGLFVLTISGLLVLFLFYKKYDWELRTLAKKVEKPQEETTEVS